MWGLEWLLLQMTSGLSLVQYVRDAINVARLGARHRMLPGSLVFQLTRRPSWLYLVCLPCGFDVLCKYACKFDCIYLLFTYFD